MIVAKISGERKRSWRWYSEADGPALRQPAATERAGKNRKREGSRAGSAREGVPTNRGPRADAGRLPAGIVPLAGQRKPWPRREVRKWPRSRRRQSPLQ